MSKVVGGVISDFSLKKFVKKTPQKGGGIKKWKFLLLEQTQPNFVYITCGALGS